jgi:hypothetical protein
MTKLPYPNVRPLILTLKAGFSSYQDLTSCQMTTILLKVMLLSQRTLYSSYPGVTQDTTQPITRTVCLISLSRFLLFLPACGSQAGLLHPRQLRNGRCNRTCTSAYNLNPSPLIAKL